MPLRICAQPGCGSRVKRGRCEKHQSNVAVHQTIPRESAHKRGYGAKWRKVRSGYLKKHPLCVECLKAGRTEPAIDLDHIVPHQGDKTLFWDRKNWQGLCKPCHSRKTRKGL